MKKLSLMLLAALLALATACKRGHEADDGDADHVEGEAAEASAHAEEREPGRVKVDPSMLRDLRITVAPAESRPGGQGVTALGELAVNQEAYAEVASPLPARITALLVKAGQTVKANEPLAQLQSPELGKARSELTSARARARAARAAADRKRQLGEERIVAAREVQAAEAEAAAAEAELAAAQATLSALGATSGAAAQLTLRSPVAGTVIERNAVVGQMTDPAQPLFKVGDLSNLWLTVQAFERDAVSVKPGADAQVSLAALPGRMFQARVTWVGAQVDPKSRTVPVRLELQNSDGLLKPGMSASAFIPLGESADEVITVPAAALQQMGDGWCVFLPTAEAGAFEQRKVGRGRAFAGAVEVVQGLTAGEKVVVEGAFLLKAQAEKARGGGDEHHEH